jgi:hypothetical protein
MAFRNDLEAALLRATELETELGEKTKSNQASAEEIRSLKAELTLSKKNIRRLEALLPGSLPRRRRIFSTFFFIGIGLVFATAVAGYRSESYGVTMSHAAVVPLFFGIGGWFGAQKSVIAGWISAVGSGIGALLLLIVFYQGIWPSL